MSSHICGSWRSQPGATGLTAFPSYFTINATARVAREKAAAAAAAGEAVEDIFSRCVRELICKEQLRMQEAEAQRSRAVAARAEHLAELKREEEESKASREKEGAAAAESERSAAATAVPELHTAAPAATSSAAVAASSASSPIASPPAAPSQHGSSGSAPLCPVDPSFVPHGVDPSFVPHGRLFKFERCASKEPNMCLYPRFLQSNPTPTGPQSRRKSGTRPLPKCSRS